MANQSGSGILQSAKGSPMNKQKPSKARRTGNGVAARGDETTSPAATLPQWRAHLAGYRDKRVLTFGSAKDLEAAIDLLWTEALRELPHDTADGKTLIIPAEAVPYFTKAGLRFTEKRLRSLRDLSPEEVAKLRRQRAAY